MFVLGVLFRTVTMTVLPQEVTWGGNSARDKHVV